MCAEKGINPSGEDHWGFELPLPFSPFSSHNYE